MAVAPKRTRLPAAERRELVLRAAAAEFGANGYEDTRLDDIAAAAGVTKPVLYRHFGSKKDLYLALLARHRDDMPGFVANLPQDVPSEAMIREILDAWLAYAHENQHGWRLLFRDRGGDEDVQRFRADVHTRAREVIRGLLAGHPAFDIPADQLEATAEALSHGLAALVLWWIDNPDLARDLLVDVATRMVLGLARADATV